MLTAKFKLPGLRRRKLSRPDVVAPGGHLVALMNDDGRIALEHPEFHDGGIYFTMSGTSQSAAVVSGVAALMLRADPTLSPDDVKCRLMATACLALGPDIDKKKDARKLLSYESESWY